MIETANAHLLPRADCYLRAGDPIREIHGLTRELDSHLVVLGTHGMQGLHALAGSIANGVVLKRGCDVLAVRLKAPPVGVLARPAKLANNTTPEGLRDREHLTMSSRTATIDDGDGIFRTLDKLHERQI